MQRERICLRCMTCGWRLADPSNIKDHAGHQLRTAVKLSIIERAKWTWWIARDRIVLALKGTLL